MTRLRLLCASSLCRPYFSSSFFPDILHIHARVLCVDPSVRPSVRPSIRASIHPLASAHPYLSTGPCFAPASLFYVRLVHVEVTRAPTTRCAAYPHLTPRLGGSETIHEHASRRRTLIHLPRSALRAAPCFLQHSIYVVGEN